MAKDDVKDGGTETVTDEIERDEVDGDENGEPEEGADAPEQLADAEGDEEEVAEGDEPERPSRAQTRFQRLANEAREAKEESAALKRRLDSLESNSRRQSAAEETPEQEQQRMALMTPEERIEYRLEKAERRHQQQLQAIQYQTAETGDRTSFQNLCGSDPIAKKYATKVEETRRELMSQNGGMPIAREAILDVLIGRDVRTRQSKGLDREREKGRQNIRRQQGRPTNSRGDAQPERRRQGSTPADRLDGVEI